MERTTLVLTFRTDLDRERNVNVSDPVPGLTPAALVPAVALLSAADPFDSTVGRITDLARAAVVTVKTEDLV